MSNIETPIPTKVARDTVVVWTGPPFATSFKWVVGAGLSLFLALGGAVQLTFSEPLRDRARFDADTVETLGDAECLHVLTTSRDGAWALVETGDELVGWIHTGAVERQNPNASAAVRIGAGCQVRAKRGLGLRYQPTRKSKQHSRVGKGEFLWVEGSSKKGKWLLVEDNRGARGWLERRDVKLIADQRPPVGDNSESFPRGSKLRARKKNTSVYDRPDTGSRRGGFGPDIKLLVLAARGRWLLVEAQNGAWGWVRAEDVEFG